MGDLLVECPIHLDAVSINDILVFKCGHGFCEACLEEHFAHHAQSDLSCPTCRKSVRRREAFPLFLAPAQPSTGTQSSPRAAAETTNTRLTRELQEAKAAHSECLDRFFQHQNEIDTLRREGARHTQTIQHLRGRYELLQGRLEMEAGNSARAKEENNRMKEEVAKLQAGNHKTSRDLEQALKEVKAERERVKVFQGYTEQYKHKYSLEKKKRKVIEHANHLLRPRKEDDSLMVVDANAPDMLHQDGLDFGWLDEACEVKGDDLTVVGDEDLEFEGESEDEVQVSDPETNGKQREDQVPGPPLRFSSDWNLETFGGPSSGTTQKRRKESRQTGGRKIVKVKMPVAVGARKLVGGPLAIDTQGHIRGTVALGPRQKLNSKN